MASDISKENLIVCGNFISQAINDQARILEKINLCEYSYSDVFDYECMDYFISGMISSLNSLGLMYTFSYKNNQTYVDVMSKGKQVSQNEIKYTFGILYNSIRTVSNRILHENKEPIFDNFYLQYTDVLMYMYYFYGSKVICSFFGINVDGKNKSPNLLTIDEDDSITKDSLEEYRRYISNISLKIKQAIELDNKIKITNVRIDAITIRINKVKVFTLIEDKSYKAANENEYKYLNNRINFFNTELIRFRNELRNLEDEINDSLKDYCEKYLGVEG